MLLSQVAKKRQMPRVDYSDCGAQTVIDPMFFVSRRGDVSFDTHASTSSTADAAPATSPGLSG